MPGSNVWLLLSQGPSHMANWPMKLKIVSASLSQQETKLPQDGMLVHRRATPIISFDSML